MTGLGRPGSLLAAAGVALSALVAVFAALIGVAAAQQDGDGRPSVLVTAIDAEITPVVADQVCDGVERAASSGAEAYVVQLDTPGGLDPAMRDIVSCVLEADVPVVVHVAPRGARAASAGAIIALASHVVAMAPGTAIGAATPVGLDGSELSDKVVNDAAALAESVAEVQGRDPEFAQDIVRDGRSVARSEALELGVADLDSANLDELLADLDGRSVELASGRTVVLDTAEAAVERYDLSLFRQILQWLANPNLTFLLLSIGSLGILYELANPGVGAGGTVGVIAIVIALFSLSVLPVDAVGVVLLMLALALFVGELFVPGIGVMAALGSASLAASALFLFDDEAGVRVAASVWLPTVVVIGASAVVAGRLGLRSRRQPVQSGSKIGTRIEPERIKVVSSQAFVDGAWWQVERSDGRPVRAGEAVEVVGMRDLTLVVAPAGLTASMADKRRKPS